MDFLFIYGLVDGVMEELPVMFKAEIVEQVGGSVEHGHRVGDVLAHKGFTRIARPGLEDGVLGSHIPAGQEPRTADEAASDVGHDRSVQVRHDHHVELVRIGGQLHAGVVHDDRVRLQVRILPSNLLASLQKQAVRELHDVGLVDDCDLLAAHLLGEVEGVAGQSLRVFLRHDLEALHHSGDALYGRKLRAEGQELDGKESVPRAQA